jgi:predicted molibdopterin-dependent oxidoreductase YjgC
LEEVEQRLNNTRTIWDPSWKCTLWDEEEAQIFRLLDAVEATGSSTVYLTATDWYIVTTEEKIERWIERIGYTGVP